MMHKNIITFAAHIIVRLITHRGALTAIAMTMMMMMMFEMIMFIVRALSG